VLLIGCLAACICSVAMPISAQSTTLAVRTVVGADVPHGTAPKIDREDVIVHQEGSPDLDRVIEWTPTQGAVAGLELLILLDDGSDSSLGVQLNDIRAFIRQQPPTTFIRVGYMRNGTVYMTQDWSNDHAAANSLRLPTGMGGGSPYFSLSEFVKHWPEDPARPRREVLMISNGIEPHLNEIGSNAYVDEAIEDAQEAGIIVYTIYTPGVSDYAADLSQRNWGQNYLTQLAEETGGKSFMLGFGPVVSFGPYLDQVNHSLQNQYLLTFLAKVSEKTGMLRIRVTTEVPSVDLIAPAKIRGTAAVPQ
jgi:hypothetical protein